MSTSGDAVFKKHPQQFVSMLFLFLYHIKFTLHTEPYQIHVGAGTHILYEGPLSQNNLELQI